VGELIKPFVFLDYFDIDPKNMPAIGFHPHSGIATLTVVLDGQIFYEETSGTKGIIDPAGLNGCAQAAASGIPEVLRKRARQGFQLWVACRRRWRASHPKPAISGASISSRTVRRASSSAASVKPRARCPRRRR